MVLGSNGNGTFVTEVTPGGVAEKFFEEHGIDVVEGLRFKSIGWSKELRVLDEGVT